MGLFDKIREESNGTCRNFYFGAPEAEGENLPGFKFHDVFDDFVDITQKISEGKFLILGRKGVGKSAYIKYITETTKNCDDKFSDVVRNNDISLEYLIQSSDSEGNITVGIWFEWIVLVKLTHLICDSGIGKYEEEGRALEAFLEKNSGVIDVDSWTTSEIVLNKNKDFNISMFKGLLGANCAKELCRKNEKAPFYKVLPSLREIVTRILNFPIFKGTDIVLMFDDFDVSFKLNDETSKKSLLSLIRVAKRYNTDFLVNTKTKILVFMRDDVGRQLIGLDSDTNKIMTSYSYTISWYLHESRDMPETDILLRKFINKRIAKNFERLGKTDYCKYDPWITFIDEDNNEGEKSLFRSLLDFTLYRPRDILILLKDIGNYNYHLPLQCKDLRTIISHSTPYLVGEFKDELALLYSQDEIDSIFKVLYECAKMGGLSYNQSIDLIKQQRFSDPDRVFKDLVAYDLLVRTEKNGYQYISYREKKAHGEYSEYTYRLPKCLFCYHRNYYTL